MKQSKKPFTIHFVCRGNVYRSRLAAAYMHTLLDERFVVSSSGLEADKAVFKTVGPATEALAKLNKLSYEIHRTKAKTTGKVLADADVVVCLSKDIYDQMIQSFEVDTRKVLVWNVPDTTSKQYFAAMAKGTAALVKLGAPAFARIQKECQKLHEYLTHTAWVDIYDANNHATGLRLPMAWAADRGLYHRGIHVVVRTHEGKFVVGKRGKSIVFGPGMLEISLGGGIDTGEVPLQAAIRETHEELGVKVAAHRFKPLFVYRMHSFHPRYNKRTRGFVYVYAVTLPMHHEPLHPQLSEVQELRLLSLWQVRQILRTHRMLRFGRLMWRYKLYKKAIAYSQHLA